MINTLEVDSVILEFDSKRVLQDVYLKSETGKVTGLLGRNGTGKSCLMKIIFGEISPNDKSIRLNGNALLGNHRNASDIRYLPQGRFMPKMLSLKRIFNDFELDFMDFTTEFPGFEKFYKAKLSALSGGEQRIVEIYAILASKTKFCMLDEPFSQVMPVHVETIKNLILREKKKKGILITDHLYKYIIDICDELYVLSNGKTYLTNDIRDIEALGYTKI
ncbi:MAG: ATP-binding cassette domain-containing protein [Bacteroidetes bacterium]|jgi:ABC-type lipopolysaccharide export system ATPase subunit|nr:ATP-binding cassette domain-containing protein [Bacteroidota bacterium]